MEVMNDQMVGVRGDDIVVVLPKTRLSRAEALRHAAWLVALAEREDGEFSAVLDAVKNT